MRLKLGQDVIQNPGLKEINGALSALIMRPELHYDLIFDNGDYVRMRWDHTRGLYLAYSKDGHVELLSKKFIPNFHELEITLYRAIRGEKPREGEFWTSISKAVLFNLAPFLLRFARFMVYLCFAMIVIMIVYEVFINPLKINYLEVAFIMTTTIGLSFKR